MNVSSGMEEIDFEFELSGELCPHAHVSFP